MILTKAPAHVVDCVMREPHWNPRDWDFEGTEEAFLAELLLDRKENRCAGHAVYWNGPGWWSVWRADEEQLELARKECVR